MYNSTHSFSVKKSLNTFPESECHETKFAAMPYETTPLRALLQTSEPKQPPAQTIRPSLVHNTLKNLQVRHEYFVSEAKQICSSKHLSRSLEFSAASLNETVISTKHHWTRLAQWCTKQLPLYQSLSKEADAVTGLREPLTAWLAYLLNTLQRALSLCSEDTGNTEITSKALYVLTSVVGRYEQLLQYQKDIFKSLKMAKFNFSNVRCLTTWKKCSASFLPEQITHSSAAWVTINHPLHNESHIAVSMCLIDNGTKAANSTLLALCRNAQPGEVHLMFPPFRTGELKVLENSRNEAILLTPHSQYTEGITLEVVRNGDHWPTQVAEFLHCKDHSSSQMDLRSGLKITHQQEITTGSRLTRSKTILGDIEPIQVPIRSRLDPRLRSQNSSLKAASQTEDLPLQSNGSTKSFSPDNDSPKVAINTEDESVQSSDCPSPSELESDISYSSSEPSQTDEGKESLSILDLSRHQPSFALCAPKRPSLVSQWSQKLLKKKSSFSGDEKSIAPSKTSSSLSLPVKKPEMQQLSSQELDSIASSLTLVTLPAKVCRWSLTKWEHVADVCLEVVTKQNFCHLVGREVLGTPVLLYQVAIDGKVSRTTAVDVHVQVISRTGERELLLLRAENYECCQSLYGSLAHSEKSKLRKATQGKRY